MFKGSRPRFRVLRPFLCIISIFFSMGLSTWASGIANAQVTGRERAESASCPAVAHATSQSLLIVLLDRSLSLIATDPAEYSTSATKILADFWPGKMAVIPFTGTGSLKVLGPVSLSDPQQRNALQAQVESNRNQLGGYTPTVVAMQDALDLLNANHFPKGSEVILITDGAPSVPGDIHGIQEENEIEQNLVPQFCQKGVPINAFGLRIDQTTADGQRAFELLNNVADNTVPAGSTAKQLYSITNPSELATPIIRLIAQWRGLKLIEVRKSSAALYSLNIDTYANQAYIVTFHSSNVTLPLIGADNQPVPEAAFTEHLTDAHYDFYNLSGKKFSSGGKYSVDASSDPAASVYALEDTRLKIVPISPTSGSSVNAGQPVTLSAAFYDGNDPSNHAFLPPNTGTIVATFSLVANGKVVFQGSKTLVQQAKPRDDVYSEQITPPQTGTLTVTYSGTVQDVQIPEQPSVTLTVSCRVGDIACYWQTYRTPILGISIPLLLLIVLLIVFLIWRGQPTPKGALATIPVASTRARRTRSWEPEPESFAAILGTNRSLSNRILHRSVITSRELQDYPGISAHIQLSGKNFDLVAKSGKKDEAGQPMNTFIRKPKDASTDIVIVRGGKEVANVPPDKDFPLIDADIIRISGEDIARYSR